MKRAAGEQGASLILALAFVSALGVFTSVLLAYTGTGIRATVAVRDERRAAYATEGSLQTAIQYVRGDAARGRDPARGGACPRLSLPVPGGSTVDVTCVGRRDSGLVVPGVNAPRHAALTLASGSEPGITTAGSGVLGVKGAVFSDSALVTGASSRIEAGDAPVTARGPCDPARVAGTPVRCSATDPPATDPGYASAVTTLPPYRPVPPCNGPGRLVELQPGYYDDASGLSALTNGSCVGAVVWLRPGAYYLDFDLDTRRAPVWHIDDPSVRIVGGTPKGWVPGAGAPPPTGSCATERDPTPNAGVQLVFGGAGRVYLDRGSMQLCATPSAITQQLAIVGNAAGAAPAGVFASSVAGSAADVPGRLPFSNRDNARIIGGNPARTADVTIAAASPSVAAVQLASFAAVSPPSGAGRFGATLLVAHQESVPAGSVITTRPGRASTPPPLPPDTEAPPDPPSPPPPPGGPGGGTIGPAPPPVLAPAPTGSYALRATLTPGNGAPACTWDVPGSSTTVVHSLDVTTCLDTAAKRAGATVRLEVAATANQGMTEALDGIQLFYSWLPPGVRAQSGCVTAVGFGGCPMLRMTAGARLAVDGTVAAPLATFGLDAGGSDGVMLGRGIVSRSLTVTGLPAIDPAGRIRLLASRDVELVARAAGLRTGRALVHLEDSPRPGQSVRVLEWSGSR